MEMRHLRFCATICERPLLYPLLRTHSLIPGAFWLFDGLLSLLRRVVRLDLKAKWRKLLYRNYACQIWGLSEKQFTDKIFKIQKNALRIISRAGFNSHTSPLFKSYNILKVQDQVILMNWLFVHDYLNGKLPKSFDNTFTKLSDVHVPVGSIHYKVSTINSELGCLQLPRVLTYGLNSIYRNSIVNWNTYVKLFKNDNIVNMSKNRLR